MKLLIDIDESEYKNIKEYYEKTNPIEATYYHLYHGTPIFDDTTNGEILKIMFPNMTNIGLVFIANKTILVEIGGDTHTFDLDWWNAPYKEVNNESIN